MQHELLAGFVAAVEYVESLGWDAIRAHERALGERFLGGLPANVTLYGLPTMEGRVPTFAFNVAGRSPAEVSATARRARLRGVARQLLRGRDHGAARPARRRRAGRDRPLQHLRGGRPAPRRARGAVRLLLLGGTKFLGKHVAAAALALGPRGDALHARGDEPGALPRGRAPARRPRRGPGRARGARVGRRRRHLRLRAPRRRAPRRELLADAVERYVFVSSISVYARLRGAASERARRSRGSRSRPRSSGAGLRRAQGALRGGGRARASGTGAPRAARPDRRAGRPDRPLHLLAAAGAARRRGPRADPAGAAGAVHRRPRPRRVDRADGRGRLDRAVQRDGPARRGDLRGAARGRAARSR